MTEPTMRERIARVIGPWISDPEGRARVPELVDKVLAEMETPTEAMMAAGAGEFDRRNFDDPFTSSRDMAAEFWEAVMAKARKS